MSITYSPQIFILGVDGRQLNLGLRCSRQLVELSKIVPSVCHLLHSARSPPSPKPFRQLLTELC